MTTFGDREIWESWGAQELCFQGCRTCHALQHPPGRLCSSCHGCEFDGVAVSGKAALLAWSVVHRAPSPDFADQVPYTVGVVELAEGPLVEVRLLAGNPGSEKVDWKCGIAVEVTLGYVNGRCVPVARPLQLTTISTGTDTESR
ncbi:Zn-ribbon domain-containing OB-fold protein [Rhodococcus sp. NPDC059968]|uniref:Zn-ribbon domain-containing OB-fold protein n=1 Tax=Rhodococcus sp. NPDC059968 TaxID=3347017 RepID=UPI00366C8C01